MCVTAARLLSSPPEQQQNKERGFVSFDWSGSLLFVWVRSRRRDRGMIKVRLNMCGWRNMTQRRPLLFSCVCDIFAVPTGELSHRVNLIYQLTITPQGNACLDYWPILHRHIWTCTRHITCYSLMDSPSMKHCIRHHGRYQVMLWSSSRTQCSEKWSAVSKHLSCSATDIIFALVFA